MTEYDIHEELFKLAKNTSLYKAPFQECATPDCTGRAVGSLCMKCAEEADKALNELLDERECPHDRVSYETDDNGNKIGFCHDCVSEIQVDWKDYDGEIL